VAEGAGEAGGGKAPRSLTLALSVRGEGMFFVSVCPDL
jgi:hypothetical protein